MSRCHALLGQGCSICQSWSNSQSQRYYG